MGMQKVTQTVAPYYAVKLNVPWRYADVIRGLVPEGEPMSGTLLSILLDVARGRGLDVGEERTADDWARLDHEVRSLRQQVSELSERLDSTVKVLGR